MMVLSTVFVLAFSSCGPREPRGISLEQTPLISGGLGWGVVSLSYVRILMEPSIDAADVGTARRGELGRILSRSRRFGSRDSGLWYRLEFASGSGWLHETALSMYRSEAEARKMAEAGR